ASQLVVTTQPPPDLTAGIGFSLAVSAEDGFGNVDTNFKGSVALGPASDLGGTITATASAGVASFAGVLLDKVGAGYTLQATGTGLSSATTSAIAVSAAPATQLVITTEPPAGVTAGSGFGLAVNAEDGFGNLDTTFRGSVALTLTNDATGATLGGTST